MSSGSREHKTGRQKSQWSDCCGARCQRFFFDKYCLLSFALLGWNCQEGHQISCCWSLTYEEVDTMTQVFNVKAWKRFWREASTPTNFFFLKATIGFLFLRSLTRNDNERFECHTFDELAISYSFPNYMSIFFLYVFLCRLLSPSLSPILQHLMSCCIFLSNRWCYHSLSLTHLCHPLSLFHLATFCLSSSLSNESCFLTFRLSLSFFYACLSLFSLFLYL